MRAARRRARWRTVAAHFEPGGRFAAGDVLLQIEKADFDLAVAAGEGQRDPGRRAAVARAQADAWRRRRRRWTSGTRPSPRPRPTCSSRRATRRSRGASSRCSAGRGESAPTRSSCCALRSSRSPRPRSRPPGGCRGGRGRRSRPLGPASRPPPRTSGPPWSDSHERRARPRPDRAQGALQRVDPRAPRRGRRRDRHRTERRDARRHGRLLGRGDAARERPRGGCASPRRDETRAARRSSSATRRPGGRTARARGSPRSACSATSSPTGGSRALLVVVEDPLHLEADADEPPSRCSPAATCGPRSRGAPSTTSSSLDRAWLRHGDVVWVVDTEDDVLAHPPGDRRAGADGTQVFVCDGPRAGRPRRHDGPRGARRRHAAAVQRGGRGGDDPRARRTGERQPRVRARRAGRRPTGVIAWMVHNRVLPNLLMLVLLVGGFFMATRIKQEVFPEFDLDIGHGPRALSRARARRRSSAASCSSSRRRCAASTGVEEVTRRRRRGRRDASASSSRPARTSSASTRTSSRRSTGSAPSPRTPRSPWSVSTSGGARCSTSRSTATSTSGSCASWPSRSATGSSRIRASRQVDFEGARDYEIHVEVSQEHAARARPDARRRRARIRENAVEMPGRHRQDGERRDPAAHAGAPGLGARVRRDPDRHVGRGRRAHARRHRDGQGHLRGRRRLGDLQRQAARSASRSTASASRRPIGVSDAVARAPWRRSSSDLPPGVAYAINRDRSDIYRQRLELLLRNGFLGLVPRAARARALPRVPARVLGDDGHPDLVPRRVPVPAVARRHDQHDLDVRVHRRARHRGRRRDRRGREHLRVPRAGRELRRGGDPGRARRRDAHRLQHPDQHRRVHAAALRARASWARSGPSSPLVVIDGVRSSRGSRRSSSCPRTWRTAGTGLPEPGHRASSRAASRRSAGSSCAFVRRVYGPFLRPEPARPLPDGGRDARARSCWSSATRSAVGSASSSCRRSSRTSAVVTARLPVRQPARDASRRCATGWSPRRSRSWAENGGERARRRASSPRIDENDGRGTGLPHASEGPPDQHHGVHRHCGGSAPGPILGVESLRFESDRGGPGRGPSVTVELSPPRHRRARPGQRGARRASWREFAATKDVDDGYTPGQAAARLPASRRRGAAWA